MRPGAAPGGVTWPSGGDCLSHGGSRVAGCSPGLVEAEGPGLVGAGGGAWPGWSQSEEVGGTWPGGGGGWGPGLVGVGAGGT